jgi:hypothetical protein
VIRAADGRLEFIACGKGRDVLVADGVDLPEDCERIHRRGAPRAIPFGVTVYTDENLVELDVACPSDAPGPCVGEVSLAVGPGISPGGRRTLGTRRLATRPDTWATLEYRLRLLRSLVPYPRFRVTVRTRDQNGVLRRVTRTLWADVQTPGDE